MKAEDKVLSRAIALINLQTEVIKTYKESVDSLHALLSQYMTIDELERVDGDKLKKADEILKKIEEV